MTLCLLILLPLLLLLGHLNCGLMCFLLLSVGNEDNIEEKSNEKSWLK